MHTEFAWFVILGLNRISMELGLKYHLPGATECMRMLESLRQQKNALVQENFRYLHID